MDGTGEGSGGFFGIDDCKETSVLGSHISNKIYESSEAWDKIKPDASLVSGVVQKYGIKKEEFFKKNYESIPTGERESMLKAIERMDKVIAENSDMGLLGNYEIARRFEELCWGKK
jgi:hypothetical protein